MTARVTAANLKLKRAYQTADAADGTRILVDRLWPRGVSKIDAALGEWMKELSPTTELRKWFGHDPERWEEFRRRYRAELDDNRVLLRKLRALARKSRVTLVYSAHDEVHNDAIVLKNVLLGRKGPAQQDR